MNEHISVSPRIHFGKPGVTGTRIAVQSVLELIREGLFVDEICRDYYPDLSAEDVRTCVQYAIDLIAFDGTGMSLLANQDR